MLLYQPIIWLDSKNAKNQEVCVEVTPKPISERLLSLWHQYVQSVIDSNYAHAQRGDHVRADVGWKWRRILTIARIWNAYAPLSTSTRSIALSLVVQLGNSEEFPIGMLTVVPGFTSNALGQMRRRSFVWYLSDAPSEVYTNILGRHPIRGVAHALIDCSIQAGLTQCGDGMLLLHADPNGGIKLQKFYQEKCGMTQLPKGAPRISPLRFNPSEEHFHFDATQAAAYCAQFDHRRLRHANMNMECSE